MHDIKVPTPILLTDEERSLLRSVIENWREGLHYAKDMTTVDPTIRTADELVDLMSGYEDDLVTLQSVEGKMTEWSQSISLRLKTAVLVLLSVCTYIVRKLTDVCSSRLKGS